MDYTESIRKDIIAYANTSGGTIYIGIADDGTVVGVSSADQMIQRVANMARASTLISVYRNRMEIVSVGGLIPGFHLNDVTSGLSICRNPKLANVFYRLRLIEAYGTGLTKILAAYQPMEADRLFQVTDKVFKVTLPCLNSDHVSEPHNPATHQTAEEMVLTYLSTKEMISRAEVEQIIGTSSASAARILRRMVQRGVLIRIGEGKNTRYLHA